MLVTFLGVLISAVSLFSISFGVCTVGGLDLVSATSSLRVIFGSCVGLVRGYVENNSFCYVGGVSYIIIFSWFLLCVIVRIV